MEQTKVFSNYSKETYQNTNYIPMILHIEYFTITFLLYLANKKILSIIHYFEGDNISLLNVLVALYHMYVYPLSSQFIQYRINSKPLHVFLFHPKEKNGAVGLGLANAGIQITL